MEDFDIYHRAIEAVRNGATFKVDFKTKTLTINRTKVIDNGTFDGRFKCGEPKDIIANIERLYYLYQHSLPSERSENKRKRYFRALPESELSDDDMMFGEYREVAQIALEMAVLCAAMGGEIARLFTDKMWFWQSPNNPSLIILKQWF